jgi:WbqC-like protein
MTALVTVHQPNFMLWVKLLDKILASDVYVAYDTVQYTKKEFHSRQKVKRPTGPDWLSVPVIQNGLQKIEAVRIDDRSNWRRKHLGILAQDYRRAKFFDDVYPLVRGVYGHNHEYLADLSLDLIAAFLRYLGSSTRIVRASELVHEGDNTARLIALIRNAGGDTHLTSTFGSDRRYIDWHRLQAAGIPVYSQEFDHPVYHQLHGDFVPHLSALDMLMCCGPETTDILDASRHLVAVPEQKGWQ